MLPTTHRPFHHRNTTSPVRDCWSFLPAEHLTMNDKITTAGPVHFIAFQYQVWPCNDRLSDDNQRSTSSAAVLSINQAGDLTWLMMLPFNADSKRLINAYDDDNSHYSSVNKWLLCHDYPYYHYQFQFSFHSLLQSGQVFKNWHSKF